MKLVEEVGTLNSGRTWLLRPLMLQFLRIALIVGVLLGAAAQAGTVTYVYTDAQGTPVMEADAQGNITAAFDYTPYGSQALGSPPAGPGYTGHVNDPDTGFVYMQARYYDPVVGRFLSVDPIGPAPGNTFQFNGYAYANNNPIVNIDPDGRSVYTKLFKLAINGGNVAQTVAGIASDAKTVMNPNASTGERIFATASIVSEALPVSVGDAKDVAKGVKTVAEKVARYSRKEYGYRSNNPAARATRQAAEGQRCPKCDQRMVSGTNTAPQAQHEPPISEVHYDGEGASMTSSEKRSYANSEGALNGANCRSCQSKEGAAQRQYVREKELDQQ